MCPTVPTQTVSPHRAHIGAAAAALAWALLLIDNKSKQYRVFSALDSTRRGATAGEKSPPKGCRRAMGEKLWNCRPQMTSIV
jgi:hypothetical protein